MENWLWRSVKASAGAAIIFLAAGFAAETSAWAFDITTHHYDTLRTGWNASEKILTPANVGSPSFKLIATATVDEQVDAQPLVMLNQTVKDKGTHTVVYVTTANNTIYAIDGETGAILLSRHLARPVPYAKASYCPLNSDVIGMAATPVIDTSTGILYAIADTLEAGEPSVRLYALKLHDLTDAVPSVTVEASHTLSNGSTYNFNPSVTRSRSALLLLNGNIYAGFTSYCDFFPKKTRGWLLGWNATTLAPLPNDWLTNKEAKSTYDFFLTSIWMSGSGVAGVGNSLYFVTGNSDPKGNSWNQHQNLTESVVRLSTNLTTLLSSFTPYTYPLLDESDQDFGSGGILLLPNQPGPIPALATALGKDGQLFLMNREVLGGYNTQTNAVLGVYPGGPCWCAESYFTGSDGINRVVSSGGSQLQTWQVHTSPSPTLVKDAWSQSIKSGQDPGFFTTVSSNGNTNGIIWAVGRPDGSNSNAVYLDAFDANTGNPLVTNLIAGYWPNVSADANLVPVVTNGKVYVGSYKRLAIFGLAASNASASIEPIAAPQLALPPGVHRLTGKITSVSGTKIVLSSRSGTVVTVDATDAEKPNQIPGSGGTLTVVGQYNADGTLLAQSISRAKSNPAVWLPDR